VLSFKLANFDDFEISLGKSYFFGKVPFLATFGENLALFHATFGHTESRFATIAREPKKAKNGSAVVRRHPV
jgi:hypothetical protein